MLVNDGEMSIWSYTHFTIIDYHFTIINEHITIISLKYTIIFSFDHYWEASPTELIFLSLHYELWLINIPRNFILKVLFLWYVLEGRSPAPSTCIKTIPQPGEKKGIQDYYEERWLSEWADRGWMYKLPFNLKLKKQLLLRAVWP